LCLPHFEMEEQTIFPVFGLLEDLALHAVRPEMAKILPLISALSARREAMVQHHRLIMDAAAQLLRAARREKNGEFAEFAYNLTIHEKIDHEVIYPTLILIGKYIRQSLGILPASRHGSVARTILSPQSDSLH